MKSLTILTFALFAATAFCLNPGDFETCEHGFSCNQLRGLVHYDWDTFTPFQKYLFNGRSWIIRSKEEMETTVTLVFKDFHIEQSLFIITTSGEETQWKEIGPNAGTNFEIIATDVNSLTLYIPRNERGRFQAFYYVGCTILTSTSGEIKFPSTDQAIGLKSTCWIVKPVGIEDMSRIYMTVRDVYLIEDARIKIEELHTNTMVGEVTRTTPYDIYGADTAGHEIILVDLECDDKLGTCEKFGNLFSLSYYAVDTSDVACIETQKKCALDPWVLPQPVCSRTCPTLEQIIEEEFVKDQTPILKSAALSATVKHNEQVEEQGNGEDLEEEEEEEEEVKTDKRIKPNKPKSKPIRCQIRSKYCKCLRTQNDARQYCFSKRKCKSYRKNCRKTCTFVRLTVCFKLRSRQSLTLL